MVHPAHTARFAAWTFAVVALLGAPSTSAQNTYNYKYSSPSFISSPALPPVAPAVLPQKVPLAQYDCNLLAARKQWTGIKSCNPPPSCPVEDTASKSYKTTKGPFWCNTAGQVTILYLNFKKIKPSLHPGTLPSSWGYFPALRILTVIANNELLGGVPGSFSLLTTLAELDLAYTPNLSGGIPAGLASSDTLSQLRVTGSGIHDRQHRFNRENFNGNPLLIIVSKTRPEICEDYKHGYPILVQAVFWSTTKLKYLGATLPKCS